MSFWIFKYNPSLYDVDRYVIKPGGETTWRVTRYRDKIKAGDLVFLWRAGEPRGLTALMKIEVDPFFYPFNPAEPYWSERYQIKARFLWCFPLVEKEFLRQNPDLEMLSVFHGFQAATNFAVSPAEGKILMKLIAALNPELPGIEI